MTYPLLKFAHLLGLTLLGAGLIGVWYADLRSRQVRDLPLLAETIRTIAVFYDGLVVPGALLLLGSGTWLTVTVYGGWAFLGMPWLVGMIILFTFEFVEGNTVTRLYFMRLRRLSREAVGTMTPALAAARREHVPTFTHFLDIPLLFVIVALGAARPTTWILCAAGTALAVLAATVLTIVVPRLPVAGRCAVRVVGRLVAVTGFPPRNGASGASPPATTPCVAL
ncbi:MAG TPA: DUF2269 family protein [Methylomirabilota bacterium]|jgi:uncharacterized membrane protein